MGRSRRQPDDGTHLAREFKIKIKEWRARMDEERRQRLDQKERLEKEFGIVGHPRAEKLYEIAWDHGHSGGYDEVEGYYREFVVLLLSDDSPPITFKP